MQLESFDITGESECKDHTSYEITIFSSEEGTQSGTCEFLISTELVSFSVDTDKTVVDGTKDTEAQSTSTGMGTHIRRWINQLRDICVGTRGPVSLGHT